MSSSLSRILSVLNLFTPERLVIDADVIANEYGLSRTSSYRYLKELCDAGLIAKRGPGGYVLGPRLIELDWMMRKYDPVLSSGRVYIEQLSQRTGLTVFVSAFYDNKIINTFILSPNNDLNYSFGRGRPLPLFRGAQAKVLISFQGTKKIKDLYEEKIKFDPLNIYSLEEILKQAKQIRKEGFCITNNELNQGQTGIAAPIFIDQDSKESHTSISVVGSYEQFELLRKETIIEILLDTSAKLTQAMGQQNQVDSNSSQINLEEVEHI
ncbi:IclR family transcriptional regulator [Acinetobacter sp. Root1280]|uniref:IclR family transcriptional regulator n=1 Tax=Acinetobacter sp. Root1280 TaxID=1736444 RepID=UPI0006F4D6ED|nr:IclR family transcriptional regulator C-terminal domain-containing protein [Acinetobacter sp. Root1280]KQW88264.1 IclR family transcriptional regulator [Acinetobacter sp. Root1280]